MKDLINSEWMNAPTNILVIELAQFLTLYQYNERNQNVRMEFEFPNGYGASVVRHSGSQGYKAGLFELMPTRNGKSYNIPGINPREQVLGWLGRTVLIENLWNIYHAK